MAEEPPYAKGAGRPARPPLREGRARVQAPRRAGLHKGGPAVIGVGATATAKAADGSVAVLGVEPIAEVLGDGVAAPVKVVEARLAASLADDEDPHQRNMATVQARIKFAAAAATAPRVRARVALAAPSPAPAATATASTATPATKVGPPKDAREPLEAVINAAGGPSDVPGRVGSGR